MLARSAPRGLTLLLVFLAAIGSSLFVTALPANADDLSVITISVQDGKGEAVADIPVTVEGSGFSTATETTDASGTATVSLPHGTFTFTADESKLTGSVTTFETNPITLSLVITMDQTVLFTVGEPEGAAASSSSASASAPASSADGSDATTGSTTAFAAPSALDQFLGKVVTGLIFGLILALASIGVSLIYGTTGLNNFAQGEMTTMGGFASLWLVGTFSLTSLGQIGAWLGLVFAAVIGAAFGWFQDFAIWKPLRRRRVGIIQAMVVSIGLSILLRYLFAFLWGPDRKLPDQDLDPVLTLFSQPITYWDLWGSVICIVLLLGTAYLLNYTRTGKAMRAVSDNKALASASGIDVDKTIRVVWVLAGLLAAVAGVLLSYYQTLYFMSGAQILLMVFAAVTLGGLGTALGGLIGSLIISVVIELSTYIIPTDMKLVTAMLVMIIILLVRPQGILGKKQRVG